MGEPCFKPRTWAFEDNLSPNLFFNPAFIFAEPVVWEQAELSLYEELWDAARTLTESEGKPLAKIYKDKEVQGTFIHFLKDHHR